MKIDLEERILNSVHQAYYKPWYQRPWGRLALFALLVLLVIVAYYFYLTVQYVQKIRNFDVGKTVNDLRQDELYGKLVTSDDPRIGSDDPKVIIVAFEDFQCPFCREAVPIIKQVLETYGTDVQLIFRDFPLESIHDQAFSSALAANCAMEQGKFWEYHDQLYARQDELSPTAYRLIAESLNLDMTLFNKCYTTEKYRVEIEQDYQTGLELGVVGTPTFFVNGQLYQGVLPFDYWETILTILIGK